MGDMGRRRREPHYIKCACARERGSPAAKPRGTVAILRAEEREGRGRRRVKAGAEVREGWDGGERRQGRRRENAGARGLKSFSVEELAALVGCQRIVTAAFYLLQDAVYLFLSFLLRAVALVSVVGRAGAFAGGEGGGD